VFDKTGTLTYGQPQVIKVIPLEKKEKEIVQVAAALEHKSEHPLAEAILAKAKMEKLKIGEVSDFRAIPGQGIEGKIGGTKYFLGNRKLMEEAGTAVSMDQEKIIGDQEIQGYTVMILAKKGLVLGLISAGDEVKETAVKAVRELTGMGIETVMLTGDNTRTAKAVAKKVGIKRIFAEVLPEEKSHHVKDLQERGKVVAMVGGRH
jgi:Cu+-exporting ATPase